MIYKKGQLPNLEKSELSKFDDLILRYLNDQDQSLDATLNNGLRLDENFDGVFVTYTSNGVADTEDTVAHTLGKVPVGFIVTDIDKGGVVYRSSALTSANLLLKCSAVSATVTIFVF